MGKKSSTNKKIGSSVSAVLMHVFYNCMKIQDQVGIKENSEYALTSWRLLDRRGLISGQLLIFVNK